MLTGEEAEGGQPDQRLHPAKPGPDRGLAEDLDQPELAGALGVGTATHLARVVAHLDDADLVAVPLAEQRHRPDPPRLGLVGDEGADLQVVDQYGVHRRDGGPVADEDRYLEVWNLVFMQFERGPGAGKDFPILGPLPHQNIDTGLGVERMATLRQGVENVYEFDLQRPILDRAGEITGTRYGAEQGADVRIRVVADHTRTATMLIGDGVTPGNEGRGYVLRRMLRRVVRTMRLLGAGEPVMRDLVAATIGAMGPSYPELMTDRGRIDTVAVVEEESFLATLRTGTTLFDTAVAQTRRAGGTVLAGEQAFALHDTYGFPIDLTLEMAAEAGLSVDSDGFRRLMAEQRRRAKADSMARKTGHTDLSAYRGVLDSAGPSTFTGYVQVATEATVRGLLRAGESVAALAAGEEAGVVLEVVLDRTPFYAEAGGQLADTGRIVVDGAELEVFDVQRPPASA